MQPKAREQRDLWPNTQEGESPMEEGWDFESWQMHLRVNTPCQWVVCDYSMHYKTFELYTPPNNSLQLSCHADKTKWYP